LGMMVEIVSAVVVAAAGVAVEVIVHSVVGGRAAQAVAAIVRAAMKAAFVIFDLAVAVLDRGVSVAGMIGKIGLEVGGSRRVGIGHAPLNRLIADLW